MPDQWEPVRKPLPEGAGHNLGAPVASADEHLRVIARMSPTSRFASVELCKVHAADAQRQIEAAAEALNAIIEYADCSYHAACVRFSDEACDTCLMRWDAERALALLVQQCPHEWRPSADGAVCARCGTSDR